MSLLSRLLPGTVRVTRTGVAVGGCDLTDLADTFGTPLVVYDEQHLRRWCAEFRDSFPDGVSYASKAFLCLAMAQLVHSEGLTLDVASGGEMAVAMAAGVPGDRLVLHGNNWCSTAITSQPRNSPLPSPPVSAGSCSTRRRDHPADRAG